MIYENYHKHSHYSNLRTLDSVTKPEDYIKRTVDLGGKCYFTTEHGFQGNIFEAYTLCQQYGLKCVYGVEAYYTDDITVCDERSSYHIMIVAMTENARKEINRIMSVANTNGFYYKPRIDLKLLLSLPKNEVIITTACVAGRLFKGDDWREKFFNPVFNYFKDNLYLEVQNHIDIKQIEYNKKIIDLHRETGVKLIHANDSHYIFPEDAKYRDMFLKAKGIQYPDESGFILDYPDYDTIVDRYHKQNVLTDEEINEALNNTLVFENSEGIEIDKEFKIPRITKGDSNTELKRLINEGWKKEKENVPKELWPKYIDQIKYEYKIIEDCGMADYFILDHYIVKRAVEEYNAVLTRSGRGSAVSFYVNKLLGLTEVDRISAPITLYPTRFMSAERILSSRSIPDIDLNFASVKPVIKASKDILGEDGIYYMVAYKPLQESSAFRLWCKAKDMNINEYDDVAKELEEHLEDAKWKNLIEESKIFRGVIESVAPSPCFEKDTLIMTSNGYKKIQDIKAGDYVMTHNNRFKAVKMPMKTYKDKALKIKFMGSQEIITTGNHPFYIRHRNGNKLTKVSKGKYSQTRTFTEPEWVSAENIKKGDYVGIAINQNSIIPEWNGTFDYGLNKAVKNINTSNKKFWWLVGRYFGDGWSSKYVLPNGNVGYYRTTICCNHKTNEYQTITKCLDELHFNYNIVKERTVYKIQIGSKELFEFLDQFGHGDINKHLTNTILDLPVDYLKVFLEGYFSADGHFIESTSIQTYSTISKELAIGIQQCIYKVYHVPTRFTIKSNSGNTQIIENRLVNTHIAYDVRFKYKKNKTDQGFYEDGYIWVPFRKSEAIEYNDYLYNMSVEDDESYTVNNMIVHNCSFLLSNDKISEMIGLIKVGDEICCCLDGYNCDVYKYLKND